MNESTRHINLTVPTGWNQCSTEQLEQIAQILLRRTAMQDRYHPYDPLQFKAECFFALAGLEVIGFHPTSDHAQPIPAPEGEGQGTGSDHKPGDETFLVRRKPVRKIRAIRVIRVICGREEESFELRVWQVHSFVEQHLKWLDDFTGLWLFPYERFGRDYGRWTVCWWRRSWIPLPLPCPVPRPLKGPAPLLDGMTWRQYRLANEWLTAYTDETNRATQAAQQGKATEGAADTLREAREGFLKALFNCQNLDYCPRRLRRMRPDQFQLCLIWWQSMMKEMQRKYRRCFKETSTGKGKQITLPIDIYTRSMSTFQEKYHLTEAEINGQPCRVLLQHLEDKAQEAEDIERINRSHK